MRVKPFGKRKKNEIINSLDTRESKDMLWFEWEKTRRELKTTEKELEKSWQRINAQIDRPSLKLILTRISRVAAIFVGGLILGGLSIYLLNRQNINSDFITITNPRGTRSEILLPDGSKVWLNSQSKLTYPKQFAENVRELNLEGEAYFDVSHNPLRPFVVHSPTATVTAFGTKFYVSEFLGSNRFASGLIDGKINVSVADKQILIEEPMGVSYQKEEKSFRNESSPDPACYAWKDGRLVLRDATLGDLQERLENWYNISIQLNPDYQNSFGYTLTITDEPLENIIALVQKITPVAFIQTGENSYRVDLIKASP